MVWLYFDLTHTFCKDKFFKHYSPRQIMSSGSGISICQFTECCIASHLCIEIKFPLTFQQPKHHFIVSSGESHKSIKLTVDLSTYELHLQWSYKKDGSTGFSTKARKSGNGTFGVSWHFPSCPVCHLSRVLHFVFLGPTATSALQQSIAYLNLEK